MKMNMKLNSELESILFKNERIEKLVECILALVEEDVVEILGTSENCFNYALYEILEEIRENNARLESVVEKKVEEYERKN